MADDLRARLDLALDAIDDTFLKDFLASIFTMETVAYAYCPDCDKKIGVLKPDYKGVASALATLADQGKGKPKEQAREEVRSLVLEELERMTDAELARIADGSEG